MRLPSQAPQQAGLSGWRTAQRELPFVLAPFLSTMTGDPTKIGAQGREVNPYGQRRAALSPCPLQQEDVYPRDLKTAAGP